MTEWIKYDGTNRPADGVECWIRNEWGGIAVAIPSVCWHWQNVTHFALKDEPKQETAKMISMDKTYRTRDGRDVRLLCVDGPSLYSVIGIMDGCVERWTADGLIEPMVTSCGDRDLIEYHEPDIRTIWVNVYEVGVSAWSIESDAKKNARSSAIAIAQPVTFEVKRK